MKTTLQILEDAWALLQKPDGWTQGRFAGSKDKTTTILDPAATCFCSVGAIGRAAGLEGGFLETDVKYRSLAKERAYRAYETLRKASTEVAGTGSIMSLNDDANSLLELEPVWERAIELAKEQS